MRILPLHGVRNEYKFQYLTEAMRKHGWQGRPVLALRWGNLTQAITGSHRIAAAKKAGVNIPVYVLDVSAHVKAADGRCVVCGETCWVDEAVEAYDDYERLEAVKRSGDEYAICLMEQEVGSRLATDTGKPEFASAQG